MRMVSAASSERALSSARVAAVSASRAAWSAAMPRAQAFGRLLQRGLGGGQRRPRRRQVAGGQVGGQGVGPGQQRGPGRAEGLGGDRRGAQCGQSSVRGVEVGPTLLGGGRQSGALVLGVLQRGPRGVAGGGRRPFLLAGRLDPGLEVGQHRPIPARVALGAARVPGEVGQQRAIQVGQSLGGPGDLGVEGCPLRAQPVGRRFGLGEQLLGIAAVRSGRRPGRARPAVSGSVVTVWAHTGQAWPTCRCGRRSAATDSLRTRSTSVCGPVAYRPGLGRRRLGGGVLLTGRVQPAPEGGELSERRLVRLHRAELGGDRTPFRQTGHRRAGLGERRLGGVQLPSGRLPPSASRDDGGVQVPGTGRAARPSARCRSAR